MNNKVGIFWFAANTLVFKTQNACDLQPDRLGFVDSTLQHQIEWEENLIFEHFALALHHTDYYHFPRGRIVFNTKLQTSFIYLDKKLFKKRIVDAVQVNFSLIHTKVKFFTDPHYNCFNSF